MSLSSASLLSPPYQIHIDGYNNIRNTVALGGVQFPPLILLPCIGRDIIRYTYHQIVNQPDMSVEFIGRRSGFRFFFYKSNEQVWYVVSNEDVDQIYLAEVAQLELL